MRRYALGTVAIAIAVGLLLVKRYSLDSVLFHQSMPIDIGHDEHERKWWKEAVVYEIYPASFKDSNDDGIGDIPGIVSKLDYLRDLGVDVVAICPHYQSPQVDMGYDISDYNDIHRPYGTLEDVLTLINETHARGMRIIFDLVINHSSNLHKFFQESRSSKDHPKRDWYFWRPAKYDADGIRHPPNNWRSHFTVPAWTWDENTEEYYLHIYAPEMPDFNWENEECRRAIYQTAMIFWLEQGIDGFRIDTVNKYSKDISFPDAEIKDHGEETQPASKYYRNGPRIHEFLGEMRKVFDRYDAMTVGELSDFPRVETEVMKFISARAGQLNMVFNFDIVDFGQKRGKRKGLAPFIVADFKRELSRWQDFVGGTDAWTTIFLENHDNIRSISRFGSDASPENRVRSGKMLAMIMATMTGTLFLYQGQEIGMTNAPRSWPAEEYKDIRSVNRWIQAQERCKDNQECLKTALEDIWEDARDHARLPMQWDAGENAGFTSPGVTPWMRINDGWKENNAGKQIGDPNSLLEFWKKILRLRKDYKDLCIYGRYELLETGGTDLFVFMKEAHGMKSLTVVNMTGKEKKWEGPLSSLGPGYKLLLQNVEAVEETVLSAWEGRLYLSSL
jgi:oligo-1,6-glucosidase